MMKDQINLLSHSIKYRRSIHKDLMSHWLYIKKTILLGPIDGKWLK